MLHYTVRRQVHNLVRPSAEILRNPRRMLLLQRLRQLLRTAENTAVSDSVHVSRCMRMYMYITESTAVSGRLPPPSVAEE